MAVNLYSNKQKWKIALLIIALCMIGAFLYVSNDIVSKVGEREQDRVKQWADAIQKKIELVQLTDRTFRQLRDKERKEMSLWIGATTEVSKASPLDVDPKMDFPFRIINENKDIPVIVIVNNEEIYNSINLDLDTSFPRKRNPGATKKEFDKLLHDSLQILARNWKDKNPPFTVEVYEGLFMTYYYDDSRAIKRLEKERDSLITAFNNELIKNEGLVPVLMIDSRDSSVVGSNLSSEKLSEGNLYETIQELKTWNEPLVIDFRDGTKNLLFYDTSEELKKLQYFPYIQFTLMGLLIMIGYLIFSTFRKAEQNQVWAGMAKETAHQLGTPLSSLIAWIQLLETQPIDPMIPTEMQKDVQRLEKITDRFSKIGSGGKLEDQDLGHTVKGVVDYLKLRVSDKVNFVFQADEKLIVRHNPSLIEWVIENICKNAVDAMEGNGTLTIDIHRSPEWVHIDIKDTGKGIPANKIKTIFEPGYTTKQRGWGLGLSLVKRIIRDYHKGKVFVLDSQVDVGTTFRISLPT